MKLALLGASGHGQVIAEIAELLGYQHIVFFDDAWPDKSKLGVWSIEGDTQALIERKQEFDACFVSIGDNDIRHQKQMLLERKSFHLINLIHPASVVSRYATICSGSVVMAGAVINAFAKIGHGCIINTGSTVDHDCFLEDCVHISPGAHLAGNVIVAECSWIGIGAVIKQNVQVGANTTIGAGAVVISNIPAASLAIGCPAKLKDRGNT